MTKVFEIPAGHRLTAEEIRQKLNVFYADFGDPSTVRCAEQGCYTTHDLKTLKLLTVSGVEKWVLFCAEHMPFGTPKNTAEKPAVQPTQMGLF